MTRRASWGSSTLPSPLPRGSAPHTDTCHTQYTGTTQAQRHGTPLHRYTLHNPGITLTHHTIQTETANHTTSAINQHVDTYPLYTGVALAPKHSKLYYKCITQTPTRQWVGHATSPQSQANFPHTTRKGTNTCMIKLGQGTHGHRHTVNHGKRTCTQWTQTGTHTVTHTVTDWQAHTQTQIGKHTRIRRGFHTGGGCATMTAVLAAAASTPAAPITIATVPITTVPVFTIPITTVPVFTVPIATVPITTIPFTATRSIPFAFPLTVFLLASLCPSFILQRVPQVRPYRGHLRETVQRSPRPCLNGRRHNRTHTGTVAPTQSAKLTSSTWSNTASARPRTTSSPRSGGSSCPSRHMHSSCTKTTAHTTHPHQTAHVTHTAHYTPCHACNTPTQHRACYDTTQYTPRHAIHALHPHSAPVHTNTKQYTHLVIIERLKPSIRQEGIRIQRTGEVPRPKCMRGSNASRHENATEGTDDHQLRCRQRGVWMQQDNDNTSSRNTCR